METEEHSNLQEEEQEEQEEQEEETTFTCVHGFKCEDCEELSLDEGPTLYECNSCGERYNRDNSADGDSHRCPSCNKFGTKVAESSCTSCETGSLEPMDLLECTACSLLFEGEIEFQDHNSKDHSA